MTFFVEEEERKKTPRASFSSSTRRKVQEEMNKRLPYFRSSFKVKEIQSEVQRGSSENGKGRRKERNGFVFLTSWSCIQASWQADLTLVDLMDRPQVIGRWAD